MYVRAAKHVSRFVRLLALKVVSSRAITLVGSEPTDRTTFSRYRLSCLDLIVVYSVPPRGCVWGSYMFVMPPPKSGLVSKVSVADVVLWLADPAEFLMHQRQLAINSNQCQL